MNVGLPGTGIGGLFYMLSVGIIFVSEVIHILRKKSSKRRWKVAVEQFFLTASMIAVAVVVNVLFATFLSRKTPVQPRSESLVVNTWYILQNHPILIPVLLLAGVLILVNLLYVVLLVVDRKQAHT